MENLGNTSRQPVKRETTLFNVHASQKSTIIKLFKTLTLYLIPVKCGLQNNYLQTTVKRLTKNKILNSYNYTVCPLKLFVLVLKRRVGGAKTFSYDDQTILLAV